MLNKMHIGFMNVTPHKTVYRPVGWQAAELSGIWWRDMVASVCWSILRRLNALKKFEYEDVSYEYTEAHKDAVTEVVQDAIQAVANTDIDVESCCILMGSVEFSQLTDAQPFIRPLTVGTGVIGYAQGKSSRYVCEYEGLPVCVSPFVTGVALIPRVFVETRELAHSQIAK